jgi:hypothetical protein
MLLIMIMMMITTMIVAMVLMLTTMIIIIIITIIMRDKRRGSRSCDPLPGLVASMPQLGGVLGSALSFGTLSLLT